MKKIIIIILISIFGLSLALGPIMAQTSLIDPNDPKIKSGNVDLCDFLGVFIRGSDIIMSLSGVFAILMFVLGGAVMTASYGNEARVRWGKETIMAAVIGIIIVFSGWLIINTIIFALYAPTSGALPQAYQQFTGQQASWGECASR